MNGYLDDWMGRSIERIEGLEGWKTVVPQPWCPTRGPADSHMMICPLVICLMIDGGTVVSGRPTRSTPALVRHNVCIQKKTENYENTFHIFNSSNYIQISPRRSSQIHAGPV